MKRRGAAPAIHAYLTYITIARTYMGAARKAEKCGLLGANMPSETQAGPHYQEERAEWMLSWQVAASAL